VYRELNAKLTTQTIEILHRRISERFPDSGLSRVCRELLAVGEEAQAKSEWIGRPNLLLRLLVALVAIGAILTLVYGLVGVDLRLNRTGLGDIIQVADAGINSIVVIGAAFLFLVTVENRIKRHRALQALHELRSLAHVIDMHQLRKDPAAILGTPTASSPKRELSQAQLSRYLDYCSEMLSLTGKIAALYAQKFNDSNVVAAVNDIELLTTGLSRKIWQKLMLLEQASGAGDARSMNRG
jgi:hypothetical protein